MRRILVLGVMTIAGLALGFAMVTTRAPDTAAVESVEAVGSRTVGLAVERDARSSLPGERVLSVEPGTRRGLGRFPLRGGRTLQVRTVRTTDGMSCLVNVEEPSLVGGSSCHEGSLFSPYRVLFVVNSDGGPGRFTDEYLIGIAAPEVALVALERTDGSVDETRPNAHGAFVIQSSPRDLERDALPAALRAYARDGSLVEAHEIPSPR